MLPIGVGYGELGRIGSDLVVLTHHFVLLVEHLSQPIQILFQEDLVGIVWLAVLGLEGPILCLPLWWLIGEVIRAELQNLKYNLSHVIVFLVLENYVDGAEVLISHHEVSQI